MQKLIIFGAGKIAEAVSYFFNQDSNYSIEAYVTDDAFIKQDRFLDKPVIGVSHVREMFPPEEFHVFVALGYQGMNALRTTKYEFFKSGGYKFAHYISPNVKGNFTIGENSIIMDYALIQPCVTFGSNVFVWGGAMIGHHANVGDNVWLTGGCQVGGVAKIGNNTFIGMGAIVGHEIVVGEKCMLGAGSITTKSIDAGTVVIAPNTEKHRLNSDQFTRMSSCFRT